jgi:uncharacterized membrane protein YfcA
MIDDPIFYAAALPAVFLMGLSKGGFAGISVLSMPLMALVMPPLEAAAIMLPILMAQDVVSVITYRRNFNREILYILLAGALAGIGLGVVLAAHVSNALIEFIVGAIAASFVLFTWARRMRPTSEKAREPGPAAGLFWGMCAGFTSFIANAGAPPFQVYVLPRRLPPQTYAGTGTMFFATINLIKFFAFGLLGQVSLGHLEMSAILLPPLDKHGVADRRPRHDMRRKRRCGLELGEHSAQVERRMFAIEQQSVEARSGADFRAVSIRHGQPKADLPFAVPERRPERIGHGFRWHSEPPTARGMTLSPMT